MAHSYKDLDLYKQHVKDYVERVVEEFNKYVEKTIVPDINTLAYNTLIEISFHQGTKVSVIGEVIKKELVLEQI